MKIQNTIQNAPPSLAEEKQTPTNKLVLSSQLIQEQQNLCSAAPKIHVSAEYLNTQVILNKAFSKQREEIHQSPSSSKNIRIAALNGLEARNFKTAPQSTLQIRLTGKGLGGMPGLSNTSIRTLEINRLLIVIDEQITSKQSLVSNMRAEKDRLTLRIQGLADPISIRTAHVALSANRVAINRLTREIANLEQNKTALEQELADL